LTNKCQLYLEEQLQDGREWMVKTVDAGIADASVFIFVEWVTGFKEVRQAFSFEKDFPKSHAVRELLSQRKRCI
jgi:hypothetical protein